MNFFSRPPNFLKPYILILLLIQLSQACKNPGKKTYSDQAEGYQRLYQADHFSISKKQGQYLIRLKKVVQGMDEEESYLLYPRGEQIDSLDKITHYFAYPVERLAINSTTHLGFLTAIDQEDKIVGATSLSLYYLTDFRKRIEQGLVKSVGKASLSKEHLIQLNPDVVFAYAIEAAAYQNIANLRESGVKVMMISEYIEADPLQKAGWLRVFAPFFGEKSIRKTNRYLDSLERNYQQIIKQIESSKKPAVMMGFPWKGSWYVSGGDSYQADLIRDAQANYLWSDYQQQGSVPLNIETVLQDGMKADYWINPGNQRSLSSIKAADHRFQFLPPLKEGRVYSNYKRSLQNGANDYWESGVVKPDRVLKDLAIIFHPEQFSGEELYFYEALKWNNEE